MAYYVRRDNGVRGVYEVKLKHSEISGKLRSSKHAYPKIG